MRTINDDIKNNKYKRVYLIYGEEAYLRKQYKDKLKKAIVGEDTMNYGYFEGRGIAVQDIIGISETLPFFAELRLIIVENSGFFKSGNDEMADYIERIPETTVLVFVEEAADKRGKLFKRVKDKGHVCETSVQTPAVLERWILGILRDNNKNITKETMNYFLAVSGTDMMNISRELEKLICYCMDRQVIETEDIKAVATEQISARIFDMIDALGYKNKKKALDIYYDLIATKEPPMRILFMLTRQFNIMLQVKELKENGISQKDIASKLSMQPFIVGKAMKQSDNFSINILRRALKDAVEIETGVKSGNLDEKIGVELLLIKYGGKNDVKK
ncbi:MAG: DNA polymerase III subunit delta [Lachnospiraceae bacterium]